MSTRRYVIDGLFLSARKMGSKIKGDAVIREGGRKSVEMRVGLELGETYIEHPPPLQRSVKHS